MIQVSQDIRDAFASGLYIVEVNGGTDIDADDDKVWDTLPTTNQGTLHSVMNDTALKKGDFKVNILTEVIYQDVKDTLTDSTQQEIEQNIEQKAQELLKDTNNGGDINGDGVVDSNDIIAWNPADDQERLKKDYETEIKPIIEQVYDNIAINGKVAELLNTAPTAIGQSVRVDKNTNKTITLTGTDPQNNALTFTLLTNPTHGAFDGTTYTPTENYLGTDSFTFKANDSKLDSAPATIAITVVDVADPNTAPTALAQSVMMDEDTTSTITLTGTDPEDDALTFSVVTQPSHGTYVGTMYTPDANYNGSDSFSFTANDGELDSQPATIDITIADIEEPNVAPIAIAQSVTIDEDTTKTIILEGTDADGDNLTFSIVTPPSHGSFDGTTYIPTANYNGNDSFTFKASDGVLYSQPATVSITIRDLEEPNIAPIATAQDITIDEDTTKTITLAGTDADGDALTYKILTPPSHGTFANGVYTPTANYNGSDSFSFTTYDGSLTSSSATVSITIDPINDAPIATAQAIALDEDTSKSISLSGTDIDGDNLTYTIETQPSHGTYLYGTYTPTANYNGSDSFSFTANDGETDSQPATISINIKSIAEPNQAPTATAQSITMNEDTSKIITLSGTDPDGDALSYTVTTQPSHGSYTNGRYTPTANYFGSDSFSFTASDGSLTSAPVTINITISNVAEPVTNRTPTATAQNITMNEDTSKTITLSGTDPDGNSLTYTVTTQPSHGSYTNGRYTPTANYNGSDSFIFTANDGSLTSSPATISITINDVAEPDTTPPNTPTITANPPTQTTDSSVSVEVNGEAGAKVFVGGTQKATIPASGKVSVALTLSMGNNDFDITLKDTQNNESGILTISVEREEPQAPLLSSMAIDISLNPVRVTKGTYTFELRTSGTAPTTTAQSAMSAWGKSSGTGNDTVILEVHDGYVSGTSFQVVVKGANGSVVGQSDVFSFSAGATDSGYGTIVLSE